MKTYDTGSRWHGSAPFWKSLRALLERWMDRERELVSLRNVVGMMSEARQADAAEYHDMQEALRRLRDDGRRHDRLLYELWRDGLLSEQQCASYRGCSLIDMRKVLDQQSEAYGFRSRDEAQR